MSQIMYTVYLAIHLLSPKHRIWDTLQHRRRHHTSYWTTFSLQRRPVVSFVCVDGGVSEACSWWVPFLFFVLQPTFRDIGVYLYQVLKPGNGIVLHGPIVRHDVQAKVRWAIVQGDRKVADDKDVRDGHNVLMLLGKAESWTVVPLVLANEFVVYHS